MKLNPDCVRDILLTVEEKTGYKNPLYICKDEPFPLYMSKYDFETLAYHINQCYLANLLIKGTGQLGVQFSIGDLTPYGHEFIANIRKDTNWNKVKETTAKIGSNSLNIITQIASSVIAEIARSQFM